ncbi:MULTISPECIES: branched-chain amino acid ABC transporter permease [unclassified Chelatococcus]|uniref:branched-chain amino acid ABC transporter permease n=1 Tax=unclassified Chelatococcus TaxID=2638111 RepID=UPI001BCF3C81|nr:branched-chain amino acid ABC transporter permease [Chelatococcus sp.]MBS7738474.1 branched-chain amino acid ABC transporter permease [Chelatococcus sp. HY11]CAH1671536.1 Branched-chain amino acid transport system permease protein [Hyphomicrobiales bacterium]MBX3542878.1 branched-chain amino acid ABC transporter permease [Chelatococcus sp.]MCO5076995.1 branched-chain amino acid ABC transporter permease [Chelatococcus sp.]CAH1676249.1 Branched-chain amino acid transport system permease prote
MAGGPAQSGNIGRPLKGRTSLCKAPTHTVGLSMRRLVVLLLIGLGVMTVAACSRLVDADQERVCRAVLPAINLESEIVDVAAPLSGPLPNSLRIDYTAKDPAGRLRGRVLLCRFAGTGLAADKSLLIGIATERGPVSDANFYFLKRFYLDAPEEEKADIATARPVPQVSRSVGLGLQQTVSALPLLAIYGLIASTYALIFGLIGRINLAFGQFAVLGGTAATLGVAIALAGGISTPFVGIGLGLVFALFASGLHGVVLGRVAIAPLRDASGQRVLIASLGLSIAMAEYLRLAQGSYAQWLPPLWNNPLPLAEAEGFAVTTTPMNLAISMAGFVVAIALIAVMRLTGFGRAWRAYADDPGAAALCGINGGRLFDQTFLLACMLAGFGGFIMAIYYGNVGYTSGMSLGLKALIAAVLGGVGSVGGAFLGGLIVGAAEALWSATLPIESRDIAIYALLAVILVLRPQGLFGADPDHTISHNSSKT